MSKIKSRGKKERRRRRREEEEKETLISFLGSIYTNKDLTLKANSKIKRMKISCSKTEAQS